MKTTIVLPLFLGLVMAGCTRTNTNSSKLSSTEPSYGTQPAVAADQTATDKAATDKAAAAQKEAADQAQVAATATPAPATDASKDATAAAAASTSTPSMMAATPTPPAATKPAPSTFDSAAAELNPTPAAPAPADIASSTTDAKSTIAGRLTEWKLSADDIKTEFDRTGRIVRSKTVGAGEPTGPMDAVLVTQINGKLTADKDTAALNIAVEANNGVVTLNGSAQTLDQIGKAVALALDTGGVKQAISLIKLDMAPKQP